MVWKLRLHLEEELQLCAREAMRNLVAVLENMWIFLRYQFVLLYENLSYLRYRPFVQ